MHAYLWNKIRKCPFAISKLANMRKGLKQHEASPFFDKIVFSKVRTVLNFFILFLFVWKALNIYVVCHADKGGPWRTYPSHDSRGSTFGRANRRVHAGNQLQCLCTRIWWELQSSGNSFSILTWLSLVFSGWKYVTNLSSSVEISIGVLKPFKHNSSILSSLILRNMQSHTCHIDMQGSLRVVRDASHQSPMFSQWLEQLALL